MVMLKNGEDGPEPSRYGNCSVYKQQPGWSYINLSIQWSIDYLSIIHDLSVSYSSLLVKNIAPFSFINLPLSIIIMSHSYPFTQHFVSGWLTGSYEIFESPGRGRSNVPVTGSDIATENALTWCLPGQSQMGTDKAWRCRDPGHWEVSGHNHSENQWDWWSVGNRTNLT
jgi:hypothetical protein